jgi:hypothetical protein
MAIDNYGKSYWCVKVPINISPNGEIYLYADKVEITSHGDLVFWSEENEKREKSFQNLSLASGFWIAFFAASVIDGAAVAVEHWEGEVVRDN